MAEHQHSDFWWQGAVFGMVIAWSAQALHDRKWWMALACISVASLYYGIYRAMLRVIRNGKRKT